MRSTEQINELSAALVKAQGAMRHAVKDSNNPHFKSRYADLASVTEAIRTPLAENGLCYVQGPSMLDDKVIVTTRLIHTSGQWIESSSAAKPKDSGPQAVGSVITYLRRYSLAAIVGLVSDDDDGEAGEGRTAQQAKQAAQGPPAQKVKPSEDDWKEHPHVKAYQARFEELIEASGVDGSKEADARTRFRNLWKKLATENDQPARPDLVAPEKLVELLDAWTAQALAVINEEKQNNQEAA